MDVRKWCEHKADEAYLAMCKTEMQDCRGPIADAFAPTITKLVEALRAWEHWYSVDSTEFNRDSAREMGRKALAELEKP